MILKEERVGSFEASSLMTKVYFLMAMALMITGVTAITVASSKELALAILGNKLVFYGLIFGELGLVWFLGAQIDRLSFPIALGSFVLYSVLNGATLSAIFFVYSTSAIGAAFMVTAGTFVVMSVYGYVTKQDLSAIGNLLLMALVGVIIATIVNMFMHNAMLDSIITYIGVLIFVGLIAYDTQKIKNRAYNMIGYGDAGGKIALMGALDLYLDFINLFLYILKLFGRKR